MSFIAINLLLYAGMASIDFKKKEKLNSLVAKALQLEGAFASDNVSYSSSSSSTSAALSEGVKTALRYISNCQQDIGVRVARLPIPVFSTA